MNDLVNSPSHYTFGKHEVFDILMDWFPKNPLLWQVGKYIARADHKGNPVQDLEKARWYLDREIARQKTIHPQGGIMFANKEQADQFMREYKDGI